MNTIEVLQRLQRETKAEVYFVGGYVRDLLRNKSNTDLDIVVRGLSMKNIKKFLVRHGKVKDINLAKTNDSLSVNILLFRALSDTLEAQISLPRRGKRQKPDSHNTLRQDVQFRDFKINSMYLPIEYKSKRDVIDLVGGKKDIEEKRITSNGSAANRIKESPVRMLRAISLAARTGYVIDNEIINTIKTNADLVSKVPAEVIQNEFNKIILSKRPSKYLKLLNSTGLLKHISPELETCVNVEQDNRYHKYDVFSHLIFTCDNCESDLVLRLAGLLHDIGKPATRRTVKDGEGAVRTTFHNHEVISTRLAKTFLNRLKYNNETTKAVLLLVKLHMYHFTRDWTDAAIRKFIKKADIGEEYMDEEKISYFPLFKLRAAERMGNGFKGGVAVTDRQRDFERKIVKIYKEGKVLNISDLNIDGNILMKTFNIKPGKTVGKILKFLHECVLENPKLNNELDLLKLTTEYLYKEKM